MSESSGPDIERILKESRTIAVLGIHPESARPAHYVPAYLHEQGYRVLGVNPRCAGEVLFGHEVVATLGDLTQAVDLVDVFRASAHLASHLPELLAMDPRPRNVWFQDGVRDEAVARNLRDAGITVVQDDCMLRQHRRLGIGRVDRAPSE